jgi:mono/diheme cytochrome c family protein
MKFNTLSRAAGLLLMCAASASWAAAPDAAQLEKGKLLFISGAVPACAICHTMEDAGATGAIGPNLDELKPDLARVKKILQEGAGSMPSFSATLDEASMDAVAAYVVHATGGKQ